MGWTADNVTEVAIIGLWTNNHEVVNVLQVRREEDDPAESTRDVLNNWQDHMVGSQIANNYVLQGARYRDRNSADGVTGFLAPDPAKPVTGAATSTTLPPNVSILVHKRVETTAAARAGRMYLTPLGENEVDEDGRLSSASMTALNAALASLLSGLSGPGDNELCVVHGTGVDSGLKTVSIVTALTTDPIVATQRRRLR